MGVSGGSCCHGLGVRCFARSRTGGSLFCALTDWGSAVLRAHGLGVCCFARSRTGSVVDSQVAITTRNASILETLEEKAEEVAARRRAAALINRSRGAKGHHEYEARHPTPPSARPNPPTAHQTPARCSYRTFPNTPACALSPRVSPSQPRAYAHMHTQTCPSCAHKRARRALTNVARSQTRWACLRLCARLCGVAVPRADFETVC